MPEIVVITDRRHVEQRKKEIKLPPGWTLVVKSYQQRREEREKEKEKKRAVKGEGG